MKIVYIGFLALGIALAVLATGGIAALLLSSANLPLVSFSAVIFALAFSTLAGMIGIIGLVRGVAQLSPAATAKPASADWRASVQHLSALLIYVGLPLGYLLGPWLAWLAWRRHSPWLDAHGRAALNFALTMSILYVTALILVFIFVGLILLALLVVFHILTVARNAWRASVNLPPHYPLSINFLR